MTPTRALIEAIEKYREDVGHPGRCRYTNEHDVTGDHPVFTCIICDSIQLERTKRLDAAISSAKVAEEGVETKIAILERCVWNMEHDAYHCDCGSMDTEAGAYMKVAEIEVREKEGL